MAWVDEAREKTPSGASETFDEIVMDSDDLQGVIIGMSTALTVSPVEDAPMENIHKKAQELWPLVS